MEVSGPKANSLPLSSCRRLTQVQTYFWRVSDAQGDVAPSLLGNGTSDRLSNPVNPAAAADQRRHDSRIERGTGMTTSKTYWFAKALPLCLLAASGMGAVDTTRSAAGGGQASESGFAGPAVDRSFVAVPFDVDGRPEAVFTAWSDRDARIHSGLLRLDDGSFDAFPTQSPGPVTYLTKLSIGVGGPPSERRAYVAWIGPQEELMLLVFDSDGTIISPARRVSSAINVTPLKIVGTDEGILIAYTWDDGYDWDPRVLAVGTDGAVLGEQIVEHVQSPEQTIGITLSATQEGDFSVVYMVTGQGGKARIRRFDRTGPLEASSVEILRGSGGWDPRSSLFSPIDGAPFLLLSLPYRFPDGSSDLRFAHTTLQPGNVTLGPVLSELASDYPGGEISDAVGLAGTPELVVVLWLDIERQEDCVCSVPPPVRIEFLAQLVRASSSPEPVGAPFRVYLWEKGDTDRPPLTSPTIAASSRTAGQFTVLWSDSLLRHMTVDASILVSVDPPPLPHTQVLKTNFPNPFSLTTTIRFSMAAASPVRLAVYDVFGREVRVLVDGTRAAGVHEVLFDPGGLPSGTYLYRLETRNGSFAKSMQLVK